MKSVSELSDQYASQASNQGQGQQDMFNTSIVSKELYGTQMDSNTHHKPSTVNTKKEVQK